MARFMYKEFAEGKNYLIKDGRDFSLESTYNLCVKELTLQQSKRDQIIAFYIAIISFVVPTIISMQGDNLTKSAGFFALFVLGCLLSKVIIRYRIYKEVYWLTCRTISQLYNFDQSKFCKELIEHIFYKTMEKNKKTIFAFKKNAPEEIDKIKTYKKIMNSAETIIYELLVLITCMVLWIGVNMLVNSYIWGPVSASLLALASYLYWNFKYYDDLTGVYDILFDNGENSNDSFNAAYSKAWFLHFF